MEYIVTLNGNKYDVEIERVDAPKQETPVNTAQKAAAPQKETSSTDESIVAAPIPGTVTNIKVSVGQQVKRGQTLIILEAMKMENEILAAHDAVVQSISVSKGASVNTGDMLLTLK